MEANPSLLLTTDPNLEFSRNETLGIPLLQSIELKEQITVDNFLITKSVTNSTNQNTPKNLFAFKINF